MSLFDVTDPYHPKKLVENWGDFNTKLSSVGNDANTIHSLFGWQAGSKAYAVLVDNHELTDVDIADITDPPNPKMVAEYDLSALFPQILQPELGTAETFFHDVIVKKIGARYEMLVSYWDGGYVKLDVTDPANATYIADSDFPSPDPSSAGADRRVRPRGQRPRGRVLARQQIHRRRRRGLQPVQAGRSEPTTEGTSSAHAQGAARPPIDRTPASAAPRCSSGAPAPASPAVPAARRPQIAVVERGVCTFTEKVADRRGRRRLPRRHGLQPRGRRRVHRLLGMTVDGDHHDPLRRPRRSASGSSTRRSTSPPACAGEAASTASPSGPSATRVTIDNVFDGWGYVRLFDNGTGKLVAARHRSPFPRLTIRRSPRASATCRSTRWRSSHVDDSLVYLSYYSGGFRVLRDRSNDQLQESGTSSTRTATTSGASRSSSSRVTSTWPRAIATLASGSSSTPATTDLSRR